MCRGVLRYCNKGHETRSAASCMVASLGHSALLAQAATVMLLSLVSALCKLHLGNGRKGELCYADRSVGQQELCLPICH